MTQYEKELLLKDLCGRLPYGVKCRFQRDGYTYDGILHGIEEVVDGNGHILEFVETMSGTCCQYYLSNTKPYLYPLSSITEDEIDDLPLESSILDAFIDGRISLFEDEELTVGEIIEMIDWFKRHHFDYRGLIKKGLAIDCTDLDIY